MGCKFCKVIPELAVAKGDIISYDSGGVPVKLAVGANDEVLVANSAEASGQKWTATPTFDTVSIASIKSGATQAAAGAAANELWKTASHATLPDNVVMIGV